MIIVGDRSVVSKADEANAYASVDAAGGLIFMFSNFGGCLGAIFEFSRDLLEAVLLGGAGGASSSSSESYSSAIFWFNK